MKEPLRPDGMSGACLVGAALAALFLFQLVHFTAGYRLTADDAMFLQYAWRGWDHVWEAAQEFAFLSGRIGHFMMTPLNALGAYWSASLPARVLMVSAYFGVMLLFAAYAGRLLAPGSRWVVAFMLLGMLALHPLAYEHMPPTSYPLQNTVPFLVLLASRLWLWRHDRVSLTWLSLLYAMQAAAMLVSEYVLVLASALMAVEHLTRAATPHQERNTRLLGVPVHGARLLADALLAGLVLGAYVLFRLAFPTQYEGNSADGLLEQGRFWSTSLYHALAGTAPYRLVGFPWHAVTPRTWIEASLVAALTFAAGWYLLLRIPLPSRLKALMAICVTCFFMLYMAFPLAATAWQQHQCLELGSCGYLDSRSSYLGTGVLLYCVAGLLLAGRLRKPGAPLLALLLAMVAGLNHAENTRFADDMLQRSQPWRAAHGLACELPSGAVISAEPARVIDPHRLVFFHDYVDSRVYWVEYMNHLRSSGRCGAGLTSSEHKLIDPLYLSFSDPGFVQVGGLGGVAHEALGQGWSEPEPWGVWSVGAASTLNLDLSHPRLARVTAMQLTFKVYLGSSVPDQQVNVILDGELAEQWHFSADDEQDCCRRRIDLREHVGKEDVEVRLVYQRQRNPEFYPDEGDTRDLAVGLSLLELKEEGE